MGTDLMKPALNELFMEHWVATNLISWAIGKNASDISKTMLHQEIAETAADLAGPNPTPIERSLAETASLARFALRLVEVDLATATTSANGVTSKQSESYHRRLELANRRYLSTLRTLATVRRLAVPALQINVAQLQVNVAGSTSLESLTGEGDG